MDLIVAVYEDWGIGKDGTQPVVLAADRRFFRSTTQGGTVIVGRKTAEDFPGGKPLPGRRNLLLSRRSEGMPGFLLCQSPREAAEMTAGMEHVFVIGGGSVYHQMLPMCDAAYVTKIHMMPESDTFLPNLDLSPDWEMCRVLQTGEENGIAYEMCLYRRIRTEK